MEIAAFSKEIHHYLRKVNVRMMRMMNQCIQPFGVTQTQMLVLIHLEKRGPLNISELSDLTQMPNSNISVICVRLEENGLVSRRRDKEDRRIVYVSLTAKANNLMKQAKNAVDSEQEKLANRLTETERAKILEGLSLLSGMFDSESSQSYTH